MSVPLKLLSAFTIEKEPGTTNEDSCLVSGRGHAIALCDGASQSYDFAAWAQKLCRAFIEDQNIGKQWIARVVGEYNAEHCNSDLPWMKQAAFERGSFSTLVGIELISDTLVRISSFGDTIVVLCDRDKFCESFLYENPESFDDDPLLISTSSVFNTYLTDEFIQEHVRYFDLRDYREPTIFGMTDALGRWALERKHDPETWKKLLSLDETSFEQFILDERSSRRMRKDDSTLLLIGAR